MNGYAWIIITLLFALNVVQIWYYLMRTHELHMKQMETVQRLNQDLTDERQLVRDVRIQARVMGSVPVSRLLKEEETG